MLKQYAKETKILNTEDILDGTRLSNSEWIEDRWRKLSLKAKSELEKLYATYSARLVHPSFDEAHLFHWWKYALIFQDSCGSQWSEAFQHEFNKDRIVTFGIRDQHSAT